MNAATEADDDVTCPVHRQDGVALWRQIATKLQGDIGSGGLKPGARLPPARCDA